MAEKVDSTCASCGAPLNVSSQQCALCGWVIGIEDHDLREDEEISTSIETASPESDSVSEDSSPLDAEAGVFCHNCGWENLSEANFCSSCGTKLQKNVKPIVAGVKKAKLPSELKNKANSSTSQATLSEEESKKEQIQQKVSGLQVTMLIAASFLIVAALYMITAFSKRAFPTTEAAPQEQAAASAESVDVQPLSGDVEARIQALASEAESMTGNAQVEKKREIVSLLMNMQRYDRAAPFQEEVAELSGSAEDWFQAGHFYYDWMDQLSGPQRPAVAQRAVAAYEQGLTISPDDLIVRTALAMAYLNTSTPMLGITQIRQVLDQEPDHLEGNFYFGVMLMQINRIEQAKERFERVKQLVGPDNPMYQQADIMLSNIASLTG